MKTASFDLVPPKFQTYVKYFDEKGEQVKNLHYWLVLNRSLTLRSVMSVTSVQGNT